MEHPAYLAAKTHRPGRLRKPLGTPCPAPDRIGSRAVQRGLSRDYVLEREVIAGVKGKIDIGASYRTGAWMNARAICEYDEFKSDILINQVIKATTYRMLRSSGLFLEEDTKKSLKKLYQRFGEITLLESDILRKLTFINLQRHQVHYRFPLEICKFILMNTVFNEDVGRYGFMDFERDHKKMSALFERFVFNYYKRHHTDWTVKRENIGWSYGTGGIGTDFLPIMQTDITLEKPDRKVIIDAKFYQEPMKSRFPGSPKKFASANLYQLNAYLTHLAENPKHPCNAHAEGILLYPVLQTIPRLDVNMLGHRIRIESIDLNQKWRAIAKGLDGVLGGFVIEREI